MDIGLYEHNEIAYEKVKDMLNRSGKAAVVHPTGTGKSFIAFRLCADNEDKRACWLSPSEYIYRIQAENLVKASKSEVPKNIEFLTYAKLMRMSEEEIKRLNPGIIVLDEFHRCGAEQWGKGVDRLLRLNRGAKILGLTATNVRYLDKRRDMAAELFDGNVASEMTLGEAIARGILASPEYILSIYSVEGDLRKYEKKVKGATNPRIRREGEKELEELKRALERAEGLSEIFKRHMPDERGKYIAFCSDYEHMTEMMKKVPEWFGWAKEPPHIYKAYSFDKETSKAFERFVGDEDDVLRILFCIDMLNEGVHVEGVNGVILFRPTVSPIIYKQQIGRALTAGSRETPVIFDVVNNIENLVSVGTIEEEMRAAVRYYRSIGKGDKIAVENFRITDEAKESRELFERLNETLNVSWDKMYEAARKYYGEYGNLEVPRRYETEEGYSLGNWIYTQRKVYRGDQYGALDEERIERLNGIGMVWENRKDVSFERYYQAAKKYYAEHGDLEVKANDERYDKVKLGRWLQRLRTYRKNGANAAYLTEERIAALDGIGMIWDVPDYLWEKYYSALNEYHEKHGDICVPGYYTTKEGVTLGKWLKEIRKGGRDKLTPERAEMLERLGIKWEVKRNNRWEESYEAAKEYERENGDVNVPADYVTKEGFGLGRWINRQRDEYESLTPEKKRKLNEIGITGERESAWDRKFEIVKKYYEEHGDINIPPECVINGVWISRWLSDQVAKFNGKITGRTKKPLTDEQREKLTSIGIAGRTTRTYRRKNLSAVEK